MKKGDVDFDSADKLREKRVSCLCLGATTQPNRKWGVQPSSSDPKIAASWQGGVDGVEAQVLLKCHEGRPSKETHQIIVKKEARGTSEEASAP